MRPPFTLTPKILTLVSDISLLLGKYEGIHAPVPQPELRRENRLRTIRDSLAIEGNTLNLDQVTAIFEGKRVIGPERDVLEVQNALRLYESLHKLSPNSSKDLLRAHGVLMKGLIPDAGKYRQGAVGILKGKNVSHIAPPARQVPALMDKLFDFLKSESEGSPLVRACVFHSELEFIHPFSDGNGRIGRYWQSLILTKYHPIFEYLPVESLIKKKQAEYYRVLEACDKAGNSTTFIEFSLETVLGALADFLIHLKPEPETAESRLGLARNEFARREFSRKDYIQFFKTISTATASRDLALGVSSGVLKKSGAQATARYRFTTSSK
jgi:Fic family protein